MLTKDTYPAKVKDYRKNQELKGSAFAQKMRVSQAYLCKFERFYEENPSIDFLIRTAEFTNSPVDEVLSLYGHIHPNVTQFLLDNPKETKVIRTLIEQGKINSIIKV